MRYLVLSCLSLGLAGCFGSGPFGTVSVPGRSLVDLGACAESPIQAGHEDKLCSRQNGNPYGSN
jgi:hypothetical protein